MQFFSSAIDTLKILVIALGAGLGAWGAVPNRKPSSKRAVSLRVFSVKHRSRYSKVFPIRKCTATVFAVWTTKNTPKPCNSTTLTFSLRRQRIRK